MGDKKVANGVVALSSAAVLAIYGVGYARTRAAADRFAQQAAERRPHIPAPGGQREAIALDVAASPVAPPETPVAEAPDLSNTAAANVAATVSARPDSPKKESTAPTARDTKPTQANVAATKNSPATVDVGAEDAPPAVTPAEPVTTAAAETNTPTNPPAPAPAGPVEPAKVGYKDGTYYGWGTCRHGDIQAAVVVENGRIAAARVEKCLTRYSCNWVDPIPPRILLKQGTTYDYVSGATESSDAFQDAVAEALSQAK